MSDGTNPGTPAIPAGWYPDPAGGEGKRWWDGRAWTAHLQAPPEPPPLPSFGGYIPADQRATPQYMQADDGIAYTRSSWWIAFSPLWSVVAQVFVVESIVSITGLPLHIFASGIVVVNVVLWFVLLWLAFLDRRKLWAGGNQTAASPFWVFLTPLAYLIVRAQHVRLYALGGWASVIWFCIAVVLAPGLGLLALFGAYGLFFNPT